MEKAMPSKEAIIDFLLTRKVKLSNVGPLVTYKQTTINLDGNIWTGRPGDNVYVITSYDYQQGHHLTLEGYSHPSYFRVTVNSPTHAERDLDTLRIYGDGPITFHQYTSAQHPGTLVTGHDYAELEDLSPYLLWPPAAFSPKYLRRWTGKRDYNLPHSPFRPSQDR